MQRRATRHARWKQTPPLAGAPAQNASVLRLLERNSDLVTSLLRRRPCNSDEPIPLSDLEKYVPISIEAQHLALRTRFPARSSHSRLPDSRLLDAVQQPLRITDEWNPLTRLQLPSAEEHFAAMNELLPPEVWVQ